MAKLTIGVGILLVILGVAGYVLTGSAHPTSLIPTWFGLVLVVSGVLANSEDAKKRMLWMHVAVTVGLLGFLGTTPRVIMALVKAHGEPLAHPAAVQAQAAMALICLVYVGLCVRSFIAARRARTA